jgi:hypothetical protein
MLGPLNLALFGLQLEKYVGACITLDIACATITLASIISAVILSGPIEFLSSVNFVLMVAGAVLGVLGLQNYNGRLLGAYSMIYILRLGTLILTVITLFWSLKQTVTNFVDEMITHMIEDATEHHYPPPEIDREALIERTIYIATLYIMTMAVFKITFFAYSALVSRSLALKCKSVAIVTNPRVSASLVTIPLLPRDRSVRV